MWGLYMWPANIVAWLCQSAPPTPPPSPPLLCITAIKTVKNHVNAIKNPDNNSWLVNAKWCFLFTLSKLLHLTLCMPSISPGSINTFHLWPMAIPVLPATWTNASVMGKMSMRCCSKQTTGKVHFSKMETQPIGTKCPCDLDPDHKTILTSEHSTDIQTQHVYGGAWS